MCIVYKCVVNFYFVLFSLSILSHVTSNSSLPNPSHDSLSQEKKLMEEYKVIL